VSDTAAARARKRGVLACLAAGAIWGGIFVGPRMLPQFDAPTFSLARYLCFGLLSAVLFGWGRRGALVPGSAGATSEGRPSLRDMAMAAWLGLIGNLLYFIALVTAIQRTGIAYASLIVGLLPVTTTLAADWMERRSGAQPFAAHRLLWPLAVIAAGVAAVNADLFVSSPATPALGLGAIAVGIVAAFLALAAWTVYAVHNTRYLRAHPHLGVGGWATLQGIGTLFWVGIAWLLWTVLAASGGAEPPQIGSALNSPVFLGWILFLGFGASWLGTALWNFGSRALPATLSGQMIVFETVFGLLYGFLFEWRLPHPLEAAGIVLLLAGVVWAVRRHG